MYFKKWTAKPATPERDRAGDNGWMDSKANGKFSLIYWNISPRNVVVFSVMEFLLYNTISFSNQRLQIALSLIVLSKECVPETCLSTRISLNDLTAAVLRCDNSLCHQGTDICYAG